MKRREFLATLAASTAAMMTASAQQKTETRDALGAVLPRRPLGRTGAQVTMLGVGGYHVGWTTEKDAQAVIEAALEGGIRFFDTAESYQKGESESRYGRFLVPKYREHVFLMTKSTAKTAAELRTHLDDSLRRMKTDHVDLWQVHSLGSPLDVDQRLANGVLDVLAEAKAQKKVRYVGFTGHSNPEAHLRMLERTNDSRPFDTCQMPVNVLDPGFHSFTARVIPELQRQNIALLAMKTLSDGRFFGMKRMNDRVLWQTEKPLVPGRISIAEALHFAWSLPVSVLITGAENAELLREKINLAKAFPGMTPAERDRLVARVADLAGNSIEYYKRPLQAV